MWWAAWLTRVMGAVLRGSVVSRNLYPAPTMRTPGDVSSSAGADLRCLPAPDLEAAAPSAAWGRAGVACLTRAALAGLVALTGLVGGRDGAKDMVTNLHYGREYRGHDDRDPSALTTQESRRPWLRCHHERGYTCCGRKGGTCVRNPCVTRPHTHALVLEARASAVKATVVGRGCSPLNNGCSPNHRLTTAINQSPQS